MALTDKLTAIADEIRAMTGWDRELTLDEMVEGVTLSYDKGYSDGEYEGHYSENLWFWEGLCADRTDWANAFQYWGNEYLEPAIQVKPTSTVYSFYTCQNLKELKSKHFDFSGSTPSETSSSTGNNRTFYRCYALERLEDVGIPAGYYIRTFDSCRELKTIDILRVTVDTGFNNAFANCSALEEIKVIDGVIGQNGLSFANSPKLTVDTIYRILDALADYTGTSGHSIAFGATNLAKISEEKLDEISGRGWTVG